MLRQRKQSADGADSSRQVHRLLWVAVGAVVIFAMATFIRHLGQTSSGPVTEAKPFEVVDLDDPTFDPVSRSANPASAANASHADDAAVQKDYGVMFRLFEAWHAIDAEMDPMVREELLQAALKSVTLGEIPEALAALQDMEQTPRVLELGGRLVRQWAESNPAAAAAWVAQMPAGQLRRESLDQTAISWANQDFAAAAAWAKQLPDDNDRIQALSTVIYETTRAEPAEALRLAAELEPESQRNELVRHAAKEWAMQRPVDAAKWAREVPDANLRAQVLATAALSWGEHDAWEAGRMAIDELPPGRLQADTIVGIAQRWAQRDPEQTAAWIEQFPPGELKRAAANSLAAIWALQDAPRAQYWRGRLAVNVTLNETDSSNQIKP